MQPVHSRRRPAAGSPVRLTIAVALALAAVMPASAADPREIIVPGPGAGDPSAPPIRVIEDRAGEPAGSAAGLRARETVSLVIDRAKIIRLPENTQTVIVGNPVIADVSVQRHGVAVLTGKSFGVTNVIALDGAGVMLAEALVSVQSPADSVVTVQRGLQRETYSCTPHCQRALAIGDVEQSFSSVSEQIERRNKLARQR